MAIERVPFFIGGGAEHSADVARTLAHSATGGLTGVTNRGDMKIVAQGTPQGSVLVSPGSASLASTYVGGNTQSYIARVPSATAIQIEPTGSATGRSDAVVLTITDPQYIGSAPENVNDFDYTRVEVISGVSSTITSARELNLNRPALLLARIDIPKSTGAITNAMIVDCRAMANTKTYRRMVPLTSSTAQSFSAGQEYSAVPSGLDAYFDVPVWATHAVMRGEVYSMWINGSAGNPTAFVGGVRVNFSGLVLPDSFIHHVSVMNGTRFNGFSAGTVAIPQSFRGVRKAAGMQIAGWAGNTSWNWDGSSRAIIDIEFQERPE